MILTIILISVCLVVLRALWKVFGGFIKRVLKISLTLGVCYLLFSNSSSLLNSASKNTVGKAVSWLDNNYPADTREGQLKSLKDDITSHKDVIDSISKSVGDTLAVLLNTEFGN